MDNKSYVDVHVREYVKIKTNKEVLSVEDVKRLIEQFNETNLVRFIMLESYYNNKSTVDLRSYEDTYTPNHKVKASYAKFISNTAVGYFMGIEPTWKTEDEKIDEIINAINTSNEEGTHEYELAKTCSKYGTAFELLWRDEDAHLRFNMQNPKDVFVVYDTSVEEKPKYAIRLVKIDEEETSVEVYDDIFVQYYTLRDGELTGQRTGTTHLHYMGQLPVIEYTNNLDVTADFEDVLNLIEAYNISISNTANDIEAFTDAYLVLRGYSDTTTEELDAIKKERTFLLDEDGGAEFLTKTTDDTQQENFRNRLVSEIHKLSQIPDLTDEGFAGNLTGVAIKFKLIGLDLLTGEKERMFRRGLRRRLEMIKHHIEILNKIPTADVKLNSDDFVKITFHRNIPQNVAESADLVQKLLAVLSEETLLSLLPFVDDVAKEMERKKAEDAENNDYEDAFNKKVGVRNAQETEPVK